MTMSKGAYARKMKRVARMKDQDRAARWRSRLEQGGSGTGAGTPSHGGGAVEEVLGSIGRAVREVGSALLGGASRATARSSQEG